MPLAFLREGLAGNDGAVHRMGVGHGRALQEQWLPASQAGHANQGNDRRFGRPMTGAQAVACFPDGWKRRDRSRGGTSCSRVCAGGSRPSR